MENDKASDDELKDEVINTDAAEVSKSEEDDEWMDILGSGQLKKKIISRGAEDTSRPQRSHMCVVNIESKKADGSIGEKLENFRFQIGDGEVIQGLDLAIPLMFVGEVALLEVAPRFGYGSIGRQPDIAPDETLFYRVELLSAEPEREMESYSASERSKIGNEKRQRGNWWYARNEPILAIQCYRRALDYLDEAEGGIQIRADDEDDKLMDSELQELFEDRLKVFNNLAAAQMKVLAFDSALLAIENVLRCQPNNVKALFRKGKILAAKGEFASAVSVLRRANELEPETKLISRELALMLRQQAADSTKEKSLYKKMFRQDAGAAASVGAGEKMSSKHSRQASLYPWAMAVAGTAVLVAGLVAYRFKYL